jgi:hypothetical protein
MGLVGAMFGRVVLSGILEDRGVLIVREQWKIGAMRNKKWDSCKTGINQMEEGMGWKVNVKASNLYCASLLRTDSCIMQRKFKTV